MDSRLMLSRMDRGFSAVGAARTLEAEVKHDTRIKVELECSAAESQNKKPA